MVSVNSSTMLGLSSWIVLLHIIIFRIHMLTYLDITKLDRGTVKPVWLAIQVTDLHFQVFSHILISCLTPWQWLQNIQKYCANGDQWSLHLLCPNSSPVFTTSTTTYITTTRTLGLQCKCHPLSARPKKTFEILSASSSTMYQYVMICLDEDCCGCN